MRSAAASNSTGMPVPTMSASNRSVRRAHESRSASACSIFWPLRDELDGSRRSSDIVPVLRIGAAGDCAAKREGSAMYSETTRSIKVTVKPVYLEDRSSPAEARYVWAYHVRIENRGKETLQLRNRHWKITDSHGRMQEVRGPGVVGEQPVLGPGESFEYTSGTPLPTPSGIMVGSYQMETRG